MFYYKGLPADWEFTLDPIYIVLHKNMNEFAFWVGVTAEL